MSTTFRTNLLTVAADHGDTTITAIAETTGLDQGSISRYLHENPNRRRIPKLDRLQAIARAYDVTVDRLLQPTPVENAA